MRLCIKIGTIPIPKLLQKKLLSFLFMRGQLGNHCCQYPISPHAVALSLEPKLKQDYLIDLTLAFPETSYMRTKHKLKEISCKMPVIHVKAVTRDKANIGGIYSCPVYATKQRGPTWFWNAQMKTSGSTRQMDISRRSN
jgi:hypothetical protein